MASARKRCKYDWDANIRINEQRQHGIKKIPPKFVPDPNTLAWLQKFATKRNSDRVEIKLDNMFPWLWNSNWDAAIELDDAGVKQLKQAVRQAEAMESSLDAFLSCVKDRLGRLRRTLKVIAPKSYFPLLSDDVLAMIFEFAALPYSQATGSEYDYKTPSNVSQVSRRFRAVALSLPRIWRYIDMTSDVKIIASRSAVAGPVLEAFVGCKWRYDERKQRNLNLFSFVGRITTLSDRIFSLRFDLDPSSDVEFFEMMHTKKKFASMSFPSLNELVLNYDDPNTEFRSIHFYRGWKVPSLRVLKAHNVIPEFRLASVFAGVTDFSLTLDKRRNDHWKFPRILKVISAFSSVETLEFVLDGRAMTRYFNCTETASLPTVERLKTVFPGMQVDTAGDFCRALKTPNKMYWTLEIQPDDNYFRSSKSYLEHFFSFSRYSFYYRQNDDKEINSIRAGDLMDRFLNIGVHQPLRYLNKFI
ncbi:hypothetical protein SCHPADRAFT_652344 [Schizopora paradoxa]|uniref:F-box domain-containing protein n=1 Tax=Schizopora paradoxa TaxID=27342 RepID=A0A0H2R685_9AGAM|nr:hypothetical protein SCHPADRAFT_652344 [Schizopora paradoxa]